ncbi:DUF1661 domain-containing protein [Porphyromonas gingivalis]|nr:DUF1661 domain-containing protein [Porphyromonas gingivalis]MCE8173053.1 DUF1661 domain-containing protein [Porphyromonas gingivalis]MCE8194155.1 DUF1661 domain-containing protein [Porphyromonas gingivalis]
MAWEVKKLRAKTKKISRHFVRQTRTGIGAFAARVSEEVVCGYSSKRRW